MQQRHFPADIAAPIKARRFVRSVVEESTLERLAEVAEVLTSELVTNAVVHSSSYEIVVGVRTTSSIVVVEVDDASRELPRRREADLRGGGGFGLGLVHRLAADWGCELSGAGKRVWFRLG